MSATASNLWLRILWALLVFFVAAQLFAPPPETYDRLSFDPTQSKIIQVHINRYLDHQEGLNANKGYLVAGLDYSITRDSPDDIGFFVWQANLKLFRDIFNIGDTTLSYDDILRIRLLFVGLTFALIVLLRFDWGSALMAAASLMLINEWDLVHRTRFWPDALCMALAPVILLWLCISISRKNTSRNDYLSLFLIALFAGVVGTMRASGAMVLGTGFSFILVLLLGAIVLRYRTELKAALPSVRPFFTHSYKSRLKNIPFKSLLYSAVTAGQGDRLIRATLLSITIILGLNFAAPALQYTNIKVYEILDGRKHQPLMGGAHIKWGPLYAGLGYTGKNPRLNENASWNGENVFWNDSCVRLTTSKETGNFRTWDKQSESAARKSYLRIFWHNTPIVTSVYFHRIKKAVQDSKWLFLLAVTGLVSVWYFSFDRTDKKKLTGIVWLSGMGVMTLASIIPLLGYPDYYNNFSVAMASAGMYSFAYIFSLRHTDIQDEAHLAKVTDIARFILIAVALIGLGIMLRASFIKMHRTHLQSGLESGSIDMNNLLNEYPVDAAIAFNRLPPEKREAFAKSLVGTDNALRKSSIAVKTRDVLYVHYRHDQLFALVRLDRRHEDSWVVPVQMIFKKNNYDMTTDVMALPHTIEAGVWLVSMRMPERHIDSAIIKAPQPYEFSVYQTPKSDLK